LSDSNSGRIRFSLICEVPVPPQCYAVVEVCCEYDIVFVPSDGDRKVLNMYWRMRFSHKVIIFLSLLKKSVSAVEQDSPL
jgi:hypothetical protein